MNYNLAYDDPLDPACVHKLRIIPERHEKPLQEVQVLAMREHRRALAIGSWDAHLDFSGTHCVRHDGRCCGRHSRPAREDPRRGNTLRGRCLRVVVRNWSIMSDAARRLLPTDLFDEIKCELRQAQHDRHDAAVEKARAAEVREIAALVRENCRSRPLTREW